jgi:hypothetical protein
MNCEFNEKSKVCNDETKLYVINPNLLPQPEIHTPIPSILPINKNLMNEEYIYFEKVTDEELEEAAEAERLAEDAYDQAFTKTILEKFPNIYPPVAPKSKTIEPEIMKNLTGGDKFYTRQFYKFQDKIGNGMFEYISDKWDKEMLVNAWQAITITNNWDFVAQDTDSFMWSRDPRINQISIEMERLGYTGHSGCSFGCTMRNMQYLAQHGESKFKKLFDGTHDTEEVETDRDTELEPYQGEDAMEYEQRLKELIKKRVEKQKREDKLLEYMGGY